MSAKDNGNGVSTKVSLAVIGNDIQYIKSEVHDLKELQQNSYVTKESFSPVQKIVYALVSLILIAVIGALINLVVRGNR